MKQKHENRGKDAEKPRFIRRDPDDKRERRDVNVGASGEPSDAGRNSSRSSVETRRTENR